MEQPIRPVEVFYSYAHKDEALQQELDTHLTILKRQGFITTWHNREAQAGSDWKYEMKLHLYRADIILLLLSPDFIASEFCYSVEMKGALERHGAGGACVIPIILRPVNWQWTPLNYLQVLPYGGKPVTSWPDRDEAFLEIAAGIRDVITGMQKAQEEDKAMRAEYRRRNIRFSDALMTSNTVNRAIAEVQIDRANFYYAHQRYEEALVIYEQALHFDLSNASALRGKGDTLQKLQRDQEALVAYEQVLHVNPRDAVSHRGKGDVLCKLLRWREALDAYEQATLLDGFAYQGRRNPTGCATRLQQAGSVVQSGFTSNLDYIACPAQNHIRIFHTRTERIPGYAWVVFLIFLPGIIRYNRR